MNIEDIKAYELEHEVLLLNDGTVFELCETPIADKEKVFGYDRETLSFALSNQRSVDEVLAKFTEDNCKKITIVNTKYEAFTYVDYVLVINVIKPGADSITNTHSNRIVVNLAQLNYIEKKQAEALEDITNLQLAFIDMLEGGK